MKKISLMLCFFSLFLMVASSAGAVTFEEASAGGKHETTFGGDPKYNQQDIVTVLLLEAYERVQYAQGREEKVDPEDRRLVDLRTTFLIDIIGNEIKNSKKFGALDHLELALDMMYGDGSKMRYHKRYSHGDQCPALIPIFKHAAKIMKFMQVNGELGGDIGMRILRVNEILDELQRNFDKNVLRWKEHMARQKAYDSKKQNTQEKVTGSR